MRKHLLLILAGLFVAICGRAQQTGEEARVAQKMDSIQRVVNHLSNRLGVMEESERQERVWQRRKFFNIAYSHTTLRQKSEGLAWRSQFGLSLQTGRTYFLHKNPLGNVLKFGIDAVWMDINYTRYDKADGAIDAGGQTGSGSVLDETVGRLDLGKHQLEYGMSVGPSLTVTPFYPLGNKQADYLKFYTYFHFTPSASLILLSGDGETNANWAFCPFLNYGLGLSWKAISLGYEHRWGTAKYHHSSSDDADLGEGSYKFSTRSNRIYVSFRF